MSVPKSRSGGRIVIKEPKDIQRALARRINRILADPGEDHHGGQLAALCNAWTNSRRLEIDLELEKRLERVEKLLNELKKENR